MAYIGRHPTREPSLELFTESPQRSQATSVDEQFKLVTSAVPNRTVFTSEMDASQTTTNDSSVFFPPVFAQEMQKRLEEAEQRAQIASQRSQTAHTLEVLVKDLTRALQSTQHDKAVLEEQLRNELTVERASVARLQNLLETTNTKYQEEKRMLSVNEEQLQKSINQLKQVRGYGYSLILIAS